MRYCNDCYESLILKPRGPRDKSVLRYYCDKCNKFIFDWPSQKITIDKLISDKSTSEFKF